jgi:hypothetical protein
VAAAAAVALVGGGRGGACPLGARSEPGSGCREPFRAPNVLRRRIGHAGLPRRPSGCRRRPGRQRPCHSASCRVHAGRRGRAPAAGCPSSGCDPAPGRSSHLVEPRCPGGGTPPAATEAAATAAATASDSGAPASRPLSVAGACWYSGGCVSAAPGSGRPAPHGPGGFRRWRRLHFAAGQQAGRPDAHGDQAEPHLAGQSGEGTDRTAAEDRRLGMGELVWSPRRQRWSLPGLRR